MVPRLSAEAVFKWHRSVTHSSKNLHADLEWEQTGDMEVADPLGPDRAKERDGPEKGSMEAQNHVYRKDGTSSDS